MRAWRITSFALLGVVALLALLLVALATPPGRAVVAGIVEKSVAGSGMTLTIDRMTGWLPFSVGADKIVVADAKGPFAEIDGLSVDIRTLALLIGKVSLDRLSAERIAVLRQPELPGSSGGEGALLPFAANDVRVARLELGAALAGRPAALALTGAFASGGNGSIAARVAANRIDGTTATLDAALARADGSAPLTANITLREAADGILPGLMGRTSAPAYALEAKAGLAGDALTGDVQLASSGAARFSGRFMLSPSGAGQRLQLDGNGNLAELVPPAYANLLAGPIEVAVDADWTPVEGAPLPQIAIRQSKVTTESVHVSASGELGGGDTDLSLSVDVADPDGGTVALPFLTADAGLTRLSLTGKAAPQGDVIRMELVGRLAGLTAQETTIPGAGLSLAVEARQDDPLAGGKLPFGLRIEADAIETPTGRLAAGDGAPLSLTADGTFDTGDGSVAATAQLTAAGGNLAFDGNFADGAVTGRAETHFPDLAPLSSVAGRTLAGALDATAEGTFAGAAIDLSVAGTATDLDPGEASLARLFAGATKLSARLRGQPDGGMAISDLVVDGTALQARGNATLGGETISAQLDGTLADLGRLADNSTGAATFTLTASGATARPDLDATIRIASGRLLDQAVKNATIAVKGAPTDAGWRGALGLDGRLGGGPLSGTATATIDSGSGRFALPEVDLAVGSNRITGALASTAAGPLSGTLSIDAPDLKTLAALALAEASGRGSAEVTLTPDGAAQSVAATFSGDGIVWQGVAVGSVKGDVAVADALGTPMIRGSASASAVTVGDVRLDSAEATATTEDGTTRIAARATGPDADLSGVVRLAGSDVHIDMLKGTAFGAALNLTQPVTIALDGPRSEIAGATLTVAGGSVRVDGAFAPQLDLAVVLTAVPASVVNGFSPDLGAEGTVNGRATITGAPAAPSIDWQVNWTGLRLAATRDAGLPALNVTARGRATSRATSVTATLAGAGLSLDVVGQVPFAGAGLDLRVTGTAPLALLALSTQREVRLAGNARVDVTVGGSLDAPAVSGGADLVDATMVDSDSGFGISGANGRIAFDGRRATIQQITGRFAQGGEIVVAGTVTIDQPGLPADLTVRVRNGRYTDGNVISTTLSGDLAIKGPLLGNGTVSGQIVLGRTEIQLPDRIGSSATALDVTHVNAPPDFVPPLPRTRPGSGTDQPTGGGLNLDIALTGNSGVFVRGFGIDAELGGSLRVAGTTGNPQAVGGFEMQRGRMEVFGRRFEFTRGVLTFAGGLVPVVDFQATTSTTDAVVTLNVTGRATDPQITFTSSPSLPQEEILSRLLFQRSVGTLSAAQALALVDAISQLTGAGNGGIISRIRTATGLDDLDIRQGDNGGTTVGIGKRINDNIRLGVEAGTGGDTGRVVIDLDITKNLKARGGAGEDGSGEIGLTYEREY